MTRLFKLALLTAFAPFPILCQEDFRISTEVNLVLVDVGVKDAANHFLTDLAQSNFRVFDDGRPQQIEFFGKSDRPVTLGLVVDNSGSMFAKSAIVLQSAAALVRAGNPQDEVFAVEFNDHVAFGLPDNLPFTDSIPDLMRAIGRSYPAGRTALYDGVAAALQHLQQGSNGRKAIVVISDGGDNASETKWPELKKLVESSSAAIYTIGIFGMDDPDRNPGVLKRLAEMSGGEYFYAGDLFALPEVCKTIAADIRNTYTLAFTPAQEGHHSAHHLKVAVTGPGLNHLVIRARDSYLPALPLAQAKGNL
jgi:VWFA-related protein